MKDWYGITSGLEGAFNIICRSQRKTGRTKHMYEHLRDFDTVLFMRQQDRMHCQEYLHRFNEKAPPSDRLEHVRLIVVNPGDHGRVAEAVNDGDGRVVLDHSFVEAFWQDWIEAGQAALEALNRSDPCSEDETPVRRDLRWKY